MGAWAWAGFGAVASFGADGAGERTSFSGGEAGDGIAAEAGDGTRDAVAETDGGGVGDWSAWGASQSVRIDGTRCRCLKLGLEFHKGLIHPLMELDFG
ncbi:hypothetical protein L1987_09468 [Smallanthus sonchifolius]|uniref:Uncharacterized protein n=1 Tax=Smallanthus sonchifolius TaxID=185202 RepID=A0ACB9JPA1_9ASTR|nr:hypothetical protein L1987_09468 [Smallanthus sonchifolius]